MLLVFAVLVGLIGNSAVIFLLQNGKTSPLRRFPVSADLLDLLVGMFAAGWRWSGSPARAALAAGAAQESGAVDQYATLRRLFLTGLVCIGAGMR